MSLTKARKLQIQKEFEGALSIRAYAAANRLQQLHPSLNRWFDVKWREHCDLVNREPNGDIEEDDAA